jgi:hypothetical protein
MAIAINPVDKSLIAVIELVLLAIDGAATLAPSASSELKTLTAEDPIRLLVRILPDEVHRCCPRRPHRGSLHAKPCLQYAVVLEPGDGLIDAIGAQIREAAALEVRAHRLRFLETAAPIVWITL